MVLRSFWVCGCRGCVPAKATALVVGIAEAPFFASVVRICRDFIDSLWKPLAVGSMDVVLRPLGIDVLESVACSFWKAAFRRPWVPCLFIDLLAPMLDCVTCVTLAEQLACNMGGMRVYLIIDVVGSVACGSVEVAECSTVGLEANSPVECR